MGYYVETYFYKMFKAGTIRYVQATKKKEIAKLTERGYVILSENNKPVKFVFTGEKYVKEVEEATKAKKAEKAVEEVGEA